MSGIGRDPGDELIRALLVRGGGAAAIVSARAVPWMSATFEGTRHVVVLALPPDCVAAFARGIGEAEFALRDHIVADIACAAHPAGLRVEALTVVAA